MLEGTSEGHLIYPPAQAGWPRTISREFLSISCNGDSTASLSNLSQCSVTHQYTFIHMCTYLFYRYFTSIDTYLLYVFRRKYMLCVSMCLHVQYLLFFLPSHWNQPATSHFTLNPEPESVFIEESCPYQSLTNPSWEKKKQIQMIAYLHSHI